eukprot:1459967-Ditylum_brightwellii.AAC.1
MEWSIKTFNRISEKWIKQLVQEKSRVPVKKRNYIYPPKVPTDQIDACFNLTIRQSKTTFKQLDVLLSKDSPIVITKLNTNMITFTISDYSYLRDMLHKIFQMMDKTIGFSNKHFLLVAIDQ